MALLLCSLIFILTAGETTSTDPTVKTYIFRVNSESKPSIFPTHYHWYTSEFTGVCQIGVRFSSRNCNRKIVGARFFSKGHEAAGGVGFGSAINETVEFRSPRDADGHGTHTASTAAGRYVFKASMSGYAAGIAKGVAPKARLAVYKVCWKNSGCFDSDILAAFDAAVNDGVDVISISIGGGDGISSPYYLDPIAIGAYGAVSRGVFVSSSAGNDGPNGMSVTNLAPWLTTVGAGTIDRNFPAEVILGDGRKLAGVSLYAGPAISGKKYPLIYPGKSGILSASLCMDNALDPNLVKGKIVICDRGSNPRVAKGLVVKKAGGVGMILSNGVSNGEGLVDSDARKTEFNILSGTSMSCPHVSGAAALLKSAHPDWSPAAIKSAIMTTASTVNKQLQPMTDESTGNATTPYDFGAGHLNLDLAMDPGLVYDLTNQDYVSFLCSIGYGAKTIQVITRSPAACPMRRKPAPENLNYPSIAAMFSTVRKGVLRKTLVRRVRNVGDVNSVYTVKVEAPKGVGVTVKPGRLVFSDKVRELSYYVTVKIDGSNAVMGDSGAVFGSLSWVDGKHVVRSPIVVTQLDPL
ncbi:putative cucumisin [Helianthus annuus]|nr:putative cucumisin [Helianthus annuus]